MGVCFAFNGITSIAYFAKIRQGKGMRRGEEESLFKIQVVV